MITPRQSLDAGGAAVGDRAARGLELKTWVVIPALQEATTVGGVVSALLSLGVDGVIVVDGDSSDGTATAARDAGAHVLLEPRRGYGRACHTGSERAVDLGAQVLAFTDAAGAEDPGDLLAVLEPIREGRADLVVGSRVRGALEPGALQPLQRVGNHLATRLISGLHGHRYTDLGSMRAVAAGALQRLQMREMGCGWPIEMQVKAARRGLRIEEVPMRYGKRRGGRSKISGTIAGSVRAASAMLRVVLTAR